MSPIMYKTMWHLESHLNSKKMDYVSSKLVHPTIHPHLHTKNQKWHLLFEEAWKFLPWKIEFQIITAHQLLKFGKNQFTFHYIMRTMFISVGQLLSSNPVIELVINNLLASYWFLSIIDYIDNHLVMTFQNLITYLDDLSIIIIGYQSFNTNTKPLKNRFF
jgi:hypothetical protein